MFFQSERQSEILNSLKDLADEKFLQLRSEILDTVQKARDEETEAMSVLSSQLIILAENAHHQKTTCILDSLDFESSQSRQSDISTLKRGPFSGFSTNVIVHKISPLDFESGHFLEKTSTGYQVSQDPVNRS